MQMVQSGSFSLSEMSFFTDLVKEIAMVFRSSLECQSFNKIAGEIANNVYHEVVNHA